LLNNNPLDLNFELIGNQERYRSVGLTNGCRLLSVAWTIRQGKVRAIAAFPASVSEEGFSGETRMKKQTEQQPERAMPAFATEAEEAAWWYMNRNIHGKRLLAAVKNGEAQVLTKQKLRERIAASNKTPAPTVSLRIPAADLALARKQAEQRGLPYQTYIKSLLHETLTEREKRKLGR
jgi:predicted DNA binding CopG/RHH family protein